MARFVYERVDAQLHEACVVISPLPIQGLRALPDRWLTLPTEDDFEGERAQLREVGAFDCDDIATLFFVKYLAKLSGSAWKVFPCYIDADRRFRRYAQI